MKRKAILILLILVLLCPQMTTAASSDLVISEIMYDLAGADSGREWIEVYNSGLESINVLAGSGNSTWRFFDGANHILNLINGTSTIASQEYFIIASDANQFLIDYPGFTGTVFDTVMNLVNSSSTIALSFDGGASQNIVADYNSTWGANGNGNTLEKIVLNQDSSQSNWQVSNILGGTPGQSNSQPADNRGDNPSGDDGSGDENPPDNNEGENPPVSQGQTSGGINNNWDQVKISEFLPNPTGSDESEWIELYNSGNSSIDLVGYKLQDNSARVFTLAEDTNLNFNISPNSYLVLPKSLTGISLNNTGGDSVKLYDPNNNLLESISYTDTAIENKSYARINNAFVWTASLTPGAANIMVANLAPQAKISILTKELIAGQKIILSAEASLDPEEGHLTYGWDFGDDLKGDEVKENHIYESPGNYLVSLKVTDSGGLVGETTSLLNISSLEPEIKIKDIAPIDFQPSDLMISEFLPNPVGSDETEWIELYNASAKNINLTGWQLDDEEGGGKPYLFNASSSIAAGEFLLISRQISKITLNNQVDAVRLLTPLGEVWQTVVYDKTKEGQSQAWDLVNQEWFWTTSPSPQAPNLQEFNNIEQTLIMANWQDKQLINISGLALNPSSTSSRSLFIAPLDNDNSFDYENVIEIYNSKKDWPQVLAGELVQVSGQVNNKYNPVRIKITSKNDIQKIDQALELVKPEILELGDLSENNLGNYLTLRAWVAKKSGVNIYLAEEIGGEIKVRASLNFSTKDLNLKKDTEIIITGVLGQVDDQYKLFVLRPQDLSLSQTVLAEKIESDFATSSKKIFEVADRQTTVRKILSSLMFVLAGILIWLLIKHNKKHPI